MRVTVCIVGYRNLADIQACVAALEASQYPDFDIVICENGGSEASEALRAGLPRTLPSGSEVEVIASERNGGYAAGVNTCIRARPGSDAWWILNPDTVPAPQALGRMVARLQVGDCAAVGSTICASDGLTVESRGGRWRPALARAVSIDGGKLLSDSVDLGAIEQHLSYISGASMLVSRALVERAGLMREDYFLYGEEVEWCLRAQSLGLRLGMAADAVVVHHQGTSTGSVLTVGQRSRLAVYLDERNKMLVTRDRSPALLPITAPAALALATLRFLARGAWRQWIFALEGWTAGLRDQRGAPSWI